MTHERERAIQVGEDGAEAGPAVDILHGTPTRRRRFTFALVALLAPVAVMVLLWLVFYGADMACSRPWSVAEEWQGSADEAPTLFPVRQNGKWGYIDKTGQLVIDFQYSSAEGFSEGLAAVWSDGHYGYIDESGTMVIPPQFDDAAFFEDGLAAVGGLSVGAGFDGFIDKTGTVVLPANSELKYSRDFSEGLAGVSLGWGHDWGFMDQAGKLVIRLSDVESVRWFHDGLCSVQVEGGLVGYIDRTGEFVIEPQFVYASDFSDGLAVARYDYLSESRQHVIIDTTGRVVRELAFDRVYGFSEGRAPVMVGGLWAAMETGLDTSDPEESWGFIDESGDLVIPTRFASVQDFRGGLAYVEEHNGKMAYVDLDGNYVWQEQ